MPLFLRGEQPLLSAGPISLSLSKRPHQTLLLLLLPGGKVFSNLPARNLWADFQHLQNFVMGPVVF